MLVFDYQCPKCDRRDENVLVDGAESAVICPCGAPMTRLDSAPHVFSVIVPTYPGSDRLKAGGVHKAQRQPATKTQIGYGGGQSPENPKGGK
jgi:hypothetical protein